jgi:uncharacterized protein (DUF1778 family)
MARYRTSNIEIDLTLDERLEMQISRDQKLSLQRAAELAHL